MIKLPDYHLTELIYEGNDNQVWRGVRKKDNIRVIVKFLKNEYPTNEQIARFNYEYNLIKTLGKEVTVEAYDLLPYQNSLVMILEAFGTGTLKELLSKRPLGLKDALLLAIKLVEALANIQLQNVIHKDLNPANILLDSVSGTVKIIDFGLATTLSHETPEVRTPNVLEGALAYISPEQTGRMNRGIDYRSDYYSLGVIFYEMFTGQLPFQSIDPIELVHNHIARPPAPLFEINENVPRILSDLVMKLLAKSPEERYQSTAGLKVDLEECLKQLKEHGVIEPFPLGTQDFTYHFQIPEKLYGREFEIQTILESFDKVGKGSTEFILIAGNAGIGKSRLVQEMHRPILEKKGWFISGKFDKIERNTPYSAILQAFQGLIQQILLEPQSQLTVWKVQLLSALGPNGQVMVEVLPILEKLIGPQPPVPALNPKEAQNRFHLTFLNFIRAFTLAENPLAIFLDDLQWADLPSLKLLELLLTEQEVHYLLILGAYRDNEVDTAHPLMITLENLKKYAIPYQTLLLTPLSLLDIQQLLADTLHYEKEDVLELATLSLKKTQGNPFFLNQFLQTLYDNHLIEFNKTFGKWVFDISTIQKQDITENVVALMVDKFKNLSPQAQETLKYASCIGNQFDLKTLSVVLEKPANKIAEELWESLREGFIIPLNENYKFTSEKELEEAFYKFLHDRVREAAYTTIESSEKKRIHLKIGRLILKNCTPQEQEEKIFDIIQHLNIGVEGVTTELERTVLIRLNLLAGKKAFVSAAYDSAYTYFHCGIDLLSKNCWEEYYGLSLELYLKATEASYLLRHYEEMETFNELILRNAKTLLDKIKVYEIRILVYVLRDELLKAISESISVLKQLGVYLPNNPNTFQVILGLIKLKWLLSGKKVEDMIQLPAMTDPYKLAAARIMVGTGSAAIFAMPLLFPFCVIEGLKLCLKYGNAPDPTTTYSAYGVLCCGVLNDIEQGYAFGQASLKVIEQYANKENEAKTLIGFYGCIDHWKNPLRSGLSGLQNAYLRGLEVGAFEDAAYAIMFYEVHSFYAGLELKKIEKDMEKLHIFFEHHEHKMAFATFTIFQQMIHNLANDRPDPWILIGDLYDEEKYVPVHRKAADHTALYVIYSSKAILSYLFYKETLAMQNFELAEAYKDSALATIPLTAGIFFKTLTLLAIYTKEEPSKKRKSLKLIKKNLHLIKKWSSSSPNNYLQKYYLIEAELARVLGNFELASNSYEKAIMYSKKHEFLNDEALCYELTGKFYLEQETKTIAELYITKAYHNYERWGATTKVLHLEQQYPFLKTKEARVTDITGITITSGLTYQSVSGSGITLRSEMLDLSTAMKASQAIASEVDLEELLKKLMEIVLQNSGAENAYLLSEEQGQWVIDAEARSNPKQITILQSDSIEKLPYAIINQVIRKKKTVILDNASESGEYVHDLHIISGKQKSILCMPLLSQNTLKGILYLENNLAAGVFTKDRFYLLETLSSQIVISIENAKLYSRLKILNKAYQRFVPYQFLKFLGKKEITDVQLGDHVEKEMTILFCDIRNFTTLSEKLTPLENFSFINDFFKRAEPIISKYHGFIDKYIGGAIMALYPTQVDDALKSAIALLNNLKELNLGRDHKEAVKIGVGLNTGLLMLGTVGDEHRMEGTVISDAVNIASRIEDLTKKFETSLLISEESYRRLQDPKQFAIRYIGDLTLKGKTKPVTIYEVFSADPESSLLLKQKTQAEFEQAVQHYQQKKFKEALILFQKIADLNSEDAAARNYITLCASGTKPDSL